MKQLLFLLFFPCLALAQYQGNANQKITLGEQTTADGLVFRGVASIDTVTATSKITRANKQDTSAYILLDTVTNLLWHYKIGSNAWTQAGGSTFDTTTLNLVSRFGLKLNISDTASMLTDYYRSGRALGTPTSGTVTNLTGTASININGTVGATTPNTGAFTTVAASSNVTLSGGTANGVTYLNNSKVLTSGSALTFDGTNLGIGTSSPGGRLEIFQTSTITPALRLRYNSTSYFGDHVLAPSGAYTIYSPTANGVTSGVLLLRAGDQIDFATNNNTYSAVQMTLTASGKLGLGTTSPQSGYRLHVVDSVYVGGNVSASAYTTRSDYDLKDEIQNISYGINEVMQMQPVKYTYKSNGSTQLGFIAQDLGVITPEVVSFEDKMSVYYNALIPILTKAIQEQNALIKALEQRIINLENK